MTESDIYEKNPYLKAAHERLKGLSPEEQDAEVLKSGNELRASAGLPPLTSFPPTSEQRQALMAQQMKSSRTWHDYYQRISRAWLVLTGREEYL